MAVCSLHSGKQCFFIRACTGTLHAGGAGGDGEREKGTERETDRDNERQRETDRDEERERETSGDKERDNERQRETKRDKERQEETMRDKERPLALQHLPPYNPIWQYNVCQWLKILR